MPARMTAPVRGTLPRPVTSGRYVTRSAGATVSSKARYSTRGTISAEYAGTRPFRRGGDPAAPPAAEIRHTGVVKLSAAVTSSRRVSLGERGERTRDAVARLILESGPRTAAELAERLKISPAAVRRHLDALVAEGLLEEREPRVSGHRGRGRPPRPTP